MLADWRSARLTVLSRDTHGAVVLVLSGVQTVAIAVIGVSHATTSCDRH
jgi:hypothetical protein